MKKFIPIFLFLLSLSVNLWGLNRQGQTWDEIAYYNAGKKYMSNLRHLDFTPEHYEANFEHPAFGKWLFGAPSYFNFRKDSPDFTAGRVTNSVLGAILVMITFYLGKFLYSEKIGLFSALILSFLPPFIGLNKVLGLDTPTALFYVLTIFLFFLALKKGGHNIYFILTGISLGLAVSTRYSNIILLLVLPLIYLIYFGKQVARKENLKFLIWAILILAIAAALFFAIWPWIWNDTFLKLNKSLSHWGEVGEIFLGKVILPDWRYYPIYFLATIPSLLLILFLVFLVMLFKKRNKFDLIIFVSFSALFLISFSKTKQDGLRYILAVWPFVALASARAFFLLIEFIKLKKSTEIISASVILGYLVANMYLIYPYYLDYYNALFGGPRKVYQKRLFQLGWWGEGLEEAGHWLNQNAKSSSSVKVSAIPDHTVGKLRNDLSIVDDAKADYIVTNPNYEWYISPAPENYQIVHQVLAGGAPIVKVWEKK